MEMGRSAKAAEEGRGVEVEETLWRGCDWERTRNAAAQPKTHGNHSREPISVSRTSEEP